MEKRKKPSIPKPVVGKTNQQMQKEIPYYKIDVVKGLKDPHAQLTFIDANVLSMAEASVFLARARGKVDKGKMAEQVSKSEAIRSIDKKLMQTQVHLPKHKDVKIKRYRPSLSAKRLQPYEATKTLSRDLFSNTLETPSEPCMVNIQKSTFVDQKKAEYQSFLPSP